MSFCFDVPSGKFTATENNIYGFKLPMGLKIQPLLAGMKEFFPAWLQLKPACPLNRARTWPEARSRYSNIKTHTFSQSAHTGMQTWWCTVHSVVRCYKVPAYPSWWSHKWANCYLQYQALVSQYITWTSALDKPLIIPVTRLPTTHAGVKFYFGSIYIDSWVKIIIKLYKNVHLYGAVDWVNVLRCSPSQPNTEHEPVTSCVIG